MVQCDQRASQEFHLVSDDAGTVHGAIAIDSTTLGPAAGGCRIWSYHNRHALMDDAARLARGMSYKNALAGLPFGGGKAVLQKPDNSNDRLELLRLFARTVHNLKGCYVTAEDVGTSEADMAIIRHLTPYVAGLRTSNSKVGGDPSPWTALGVFESMRSVLQRERSCGFTGLRIAVQGVGNVGTHLCRLLQQAGAQLLVADSDAQRAQMVADKFDARQLSADEILFANADILAPCALGGILNERTIPYLNAPIVVGAANNQLATVADGERLRSCGIIFAPDYVVNAGGIISIAAEYLGENIDQVGDLIQRIPQRMLMILDRAEQQQRATNLVADKMAQDIILSGHRGAA